MPTKRVLVTGGCGFIGSCFIRTLHARDPEAEIINLDLLTYAGNPESLPELKESPRYRLVHGDVRDEAVVGPLVEGIDWVVHFAAESHVDRSTSARAGAFVDTNVYGTFVLLDALRRIATRISLRAHDTIHVHPFGWIVRIHIWRLTILYTFS